MAKNDLDSHDRGAQILAHASSDAGFDIYAEPFNTPEEIIQAAVQKYVDVLVISPLGAAGHPRPEDH
jgi:methylmalonyl-CoA mutase C-terminal domain/subunit